jgi:ABC-2 type transport system ATP-binding protein
MTPSITKNALAALEITGLRKTYKNGRTALQGIDLSVLPGEFFALLGPNGAGKTTTIGILTSLVNRTAGSIRIFGIDHEKKTADARALMGVVPQEINFNLFEKVEDIILNQAGYYGISRTEAQPRCQMLLESLDLVPYQNQMARILSGGFKRRLMIARALIHNPRLLILDEPTAGVDVEMRHETWQFLRELNASGTTIILTTHYLEEAELLCNRLAIIHHGEIVAQGSKKSLLEMMTHQTYLLDLAAPLATLPDLGLPRVRLIDPEQLEVAIAQNEDLNLIFRVLERHGIRVQSLRNKSNRLEELFLHLTGRTP